ncbi:MAG TPA: UDP-2,3-diacylglucosamine diphosphatase [Spongiibacteraceae bacterium]
MTTLFISDLHLQPSQPQLLNACLTFLNESARGADALYLLGDLFEMWIGDDDDAAWLNDLSAALRQLHQRGTALYFMHGNRDFLLGEKFAERCGMQLLPETCVIDLYGRPALLLHGDTLCTEDMEYQAFRAQVRNPQWQQMILTHSLDERRFLAAQLRQQSKMAGSNKAEDIMDVTPEEVVKIMAANAVDLLIHGHTHRPARHELFVSERPAERIVLGDWRENDCMWYARAESNGALDLIHASLATSDH